MRADVQIIAENDALGLRIVLRRCKSWPIVIDHDAEVDRGQHRHERRADMPASEDIRIARPRERLDVIARLTLFRDRVRAEHRAQLLRRDAVREAQAVCVVVDAHRADAAFVHAVDEPAVLIAA